jgi:hypothetical protein
MFADNLKKGKIIIAKIENQYTRASEKSIKLFLKKT